VSEIIQQTFFAVPRIRQPSLLFFILKDVVGNTVKVIAGRVHQSESSKTNQQWQSALLFSSRQEECSDEQDGAEVEERRSWQRIFALLDFLGADPAIEHHSSVAELLSE
jgi:hypothetical protein